VPVERLPKDTLEKAMSVFVGPARHAVCYYLRGGTLLNFVGCVETDDISEESWTVKFPWEKLKSDYRGWNPAIQAIIDQADKDACYRWSLHTRPPAPRSSTKRVTLLGDAAHPTLPYLAQGAAMAIEEAYVLAQALDHFGPGRLDAALDAYEMERRPRTARVQLEARERGRTYHLASPEESRARDLAFKEEQARNPNAVGIKAEWVYQYDARICRDRFDTSPALSAAS